jgi:hypothetical protein
MEGLNSLIQAAKRKARGYRNYKTFRTIADFIVDKLDLRVEPARHQATHPSRRRILNNHFSNFDLHPQLDHTIRWQGKE